MDELASTCRASRREAIVDALLAVALGLGSFGLYLATLAPTVLFADGGEFQFAPYILGIVHPTGYPLFLLLGWAWSHLLPIGEVAYRMNLFSAWWAAWAVGLGYLVAVYVVRRAAPAADPLSTRLAAGAAAATFAVGRTFWSEAVIAEVYSFNAFFVALALWLLFRVEEAPERTPSAPGRISSFAQRSLALAAAYGLSLTHHATMALLLPGIAVFIWLTNRRPRSRFPNRLAAPETRPVTILAPRSRLRQIGFAVALLLALTAPLLLYLYLPLRAPYTPYTTLHLSDTQVLTTYENTARGWLAHLTASTFANTYLVRPEAALAWNERLVMVWDLLRDQFGWVGAGLALIGLGRLVVRRRWAVLALTGLSYVAGVAFNMAYFIGDVQVLFIPSYLFVSLWLGVGVVTVAQAAAAGLVRWKGSAVTYANFGQRGYQRLTEGIQRLTAQAVAALGLALPLALLITNFSAVGQSGNTEARDTWQAILAQPIPQGAVLLSNDRNEMMPLWYYQYVEGRRPDLLGLFPLVVADPAYANVGGLVEQALSSERPVYLIKPMPGLEVKAQLDPAGDLSPLVRVTGPAQERPPTHPNQVALAGVMRLNGYDQSSPSARPGQTVTLTLYWQPQSEIKRDYTSYVHLVNEAGQSIAQSDHRLGGNYYPTSLWRPGEVLRDQHVLSIPAGTPPGTYRLVAGMYLYPSLEPLGSGADMGLLAVKDAASIRTAPPDDVQHPAEVGFGDRIMLLGYDQELASGHLKLTLYWQAERLLNSNWTVFVHLVDAAGTLQSQHDGQPRDGHYPTSVWDSGEVVDDQHLLPLPDGLADGAYQVEVGLYSTQSGERLPTLDDEGNSIGDCAPLFTLTRADGKWQVQ
jgi:hypothetical protein